MLLFFDGVAVLVAEKDRSILARGEEETICPLQDAGLLHILDPDDVIEAEVATALMEFIRRIARVEQLELIRDPSSPLSRSLLSDNWSRPAKLSREERAAFEIVWEEMRRRGIASAIGPDDSIYLNTFAWAAILAFLAQALRPVGWSRGLDLLPASDNPELLAGFRALWSRDRWNYNRSMADVVALDLEQVALDLTNAPIADLLDFRQQYGGEYQRYAVQARRFANEIAICNELDRAALLQDRRNELAAEADRLLHLARTWWRQPVASVSIGLAAAALAGSHGDWPTATLAALTGLVGASGRPGPTGIYSYLFRTGTHFGTWG